MLVNWEPWSECISTLFFGFLRHTIEQHSPTLNQADSFERSGCNVRADIIPGKARKGTS
jgi:hypothetical protein